MKKISTLDAKWLSKFNDEEIKMYVGIGFCQPKFYKPTVWKKAKRMMDIACVLGYAYPYDFGRGKGKYESDLKIPQVVSRMQAIARKAEKEIKRN